MRKVMVMVFILSLVLTFGYVDTSAVNAAEPIVIAPRLNNVTAIVGNPVKLHVSGFYNDMGGYWAGMVGRATFEVSVGTLESDTSNVLLLPDSGSGDIDVTVHYNELSNSSTLKVHWSPIKSIEVPATAEVELGKCNLNYEVYATLFDGSKVRVNDIMTVESSNPEIIEIVNDKYCRVKALGNVTLTFKVKGKVNESDANFTDITATMDVIIKLPSF